MNVCELKPEKVFKFFELISSVPHGSDNTNQISALCCKFAAERGLDYIQDEVGNVIIRKSATPGYETHQTVILQGHMDMVAVKTPESDIDLERDGLRLKTDGEYIWADGTSLGADDGIAVAMIMALMDSDDIPHPPIEAIITINEETGMDGAVFLDTSVLKGRRMINIDSEDEGIITVGCAGGARVYGQFDLKRTEGEYLTAKLTVSGLTGGHSGSEIQKGRANSNKLMGELLHELCALQNVHLVSLDGGEKDNAIANHSEAVIAFPTDEAELVRHIAEAQGELIKLRIASTDPNAYVSFEILGSGVISVADDESAASVISAMCRVPDGVQTMSADIEGLVETSLNFGVLSTEGDTVSMTFCLRSSVKLEKEGLIKLVSDVIVDCGGTADCGSEYPAWEYRKDSPLRDAVVNAFSAQYGRAPVINVIHAGLECGLFSSKIDGLDCVSIGPDIHDIHTVNEKLDIASTARTWTLLLNILKDL